MQGPNSWKNTSKELLTLKTEQLMSGIWWKLKCSQQQIMARKAFLVGRMERMSVLVSGGQDLKY